MTNSELARTKAESAVNRKSYLEQAIKYKARNDSEGENHFRNLAELERLNNRYFLGMPPF